MIDPLQLALSKLVLGELPPETLPELATDALLRGLESPSLRQLAGTPPRDYQDARDLFYVAAHELGWAVPTRRGARLTLIGKCAADIVAGGISPYDGAQLIRLGGYDFLAWPEQLTIFVGLADQWEDDPPRRRNYERAIHSFLTTPGRAAPRVHQSRHLEDLPHFDVGNGLLHRVCDHVAMASQAISLDAQHCNSSIARRFDEAAERSRRPVFEDLAHAAASFLAVAAPERVPVVRRVPKIGLVSVLDAGGV